MAAAGKPVLLIDDDALQLRVRQAVLHEAGFRVDTASTPEAALALLKAEHGGYGAIITDHLLTGARGTELVPRLREISPGIPIIVITGMPGAEDEYEGLDVRFRQKPCPPEELIALVRSVTQSTDPIHPQVDN